MANLNLSSQQIRSIKNSPKGKLPRFITVGLGKGPGVVSVGGKIGPVGAAIGLDKGKVFGSANVRGKIIGSFGSKGR